LGAENVELVLGQYVDDLYSEAIEPRKFDLEIDSYSFKYADPMAQLGRLGTDGSVNDGQYSDATFDNLVEDASVITDINQRYEAFAKAEKYMIDNVLVFPWATGGGSYQMSNVVPFTTPRGGFGVTRFKYKGMIVTDKAITKEEYKKYESQFKEDLKKATQGK
jgi:oligopeptide transport system substrate-binding protein